MQRPRERSQVEAVAAEAERICSKPRVVAIQADVTREEDCARAVETALQRFGRLDLLVNNAGRGMRYVSDRFLTEPTRFWDVSPDTWRMVIETNVNGPFLMARCAAPVLVKAGWGRIVNVSMNHETMRRRGFSPYGPSKAALESETIIWVAGLRGNGRDCECFPARRLDAHGHDPGKPARGIARRLALRDHCPAIVVARLGRL